MLDDHAAPRAGHPPEGVEKPRHDPQKRNKEKAAFLQAIIARSRLMTPGTQAGVPGVIPQRDADVGEATVRAAVEPDVLINKSGIMLNCVQKGLNLHLHSWSPGRWFVFSINAKLIELLETGYRVKPGQPLTRRQSRGGNHWTAPAKHTPDLRLKQAGARAGEPFARAPLRSSVAAPIKDSSTNLNSPTNCATEPKLLEFLILMGEA
jgi:hypothetical protein